MDPTLTLCLIFLLTGTRREALYVGWSQGRNGTEGNGMAPNTKLCITHSFLGLSGLSEQIMRKKLVRGIRRGGSQGRQGLIHPFFELQTPDGWGDLGVSRAK